MKARLLTKLLNDTKYSVNNNKVYIAVGSPLCHDLISVNKSTLKIKYALDTWNEGRNAVNKRDNPELIFIWDKLQELINSGEIHDIINGEDEIENPLPVFTVNDGELIETVTDKYGWPNTTKDGYTMYENTYFKTRSEAIEYGIKDAGYAVSSYERRKEQITEDLQKVEEQIKKYNSFIEKFKELAV